jgi:hypothetical protein
MWCLCASFTTAKASPDHVLHKQARSKVPSNFRTTADMNVSFRCCAIWTNGIIHLVDQIR